jgi:hypothetical protein
VLFSIVTIWEGSLCGLRAEVRRHAMTEYAIRFFVGGLVVSAFAALGDVFRPKTFAGLFGAAPSIALATLVIALLKQGPNYVALQGRSMVIGSIGLCLYSLVVCYLIKNDLSAKNAALLASIVWFAVAFGLAWILWGAV